VYVPFRKGKIINSSLMLSSVLNSKWKFTKAFLNKAQELIVLVKTYLGQDPVKYGSDLAVMGRA